MVGRVSIKRRRLLFVCDSTDPSHGNCFSDTTRRQQVAPRDDNRLLLNLLANESAMDSNECSLKICTAQQRDLLAAGGIAEAITT
mmetsp:Transcript_6620/g.11746  ORF Transcript_6620/g.11746 Transcript_6620/m.11746 type:complete len:85 (+) Transcript_6620:31-285(+)